MSRGLGHLQREILATLAERPGGDMVTDPCGHRAWLADNVHDLRAISREMARAVGLPDCYYATNAWQASFSRAVARLEERQLIRLLWSVPMEAVEPDFAWPSIEIEGRLYMS